MTLHLSTAGYLVLLQPSSWGSSIFHFPSGSFDVTQKRETENIPKQWLACYPDSSREQAMIIRAWRLLWNEFCLRVFTSKDLRCYPLSVTPPLAGPWTRPTSGTVPYLTPRKPVSHCLSKHLLSVRLVFPHPCLLILIQAETKMSTQPFISFHRKPSYLNMSLHLRSLLKMLCGCVAQSCPTLCSPMDCSLPGSSVRGIPWLTLLSSLRPHSSSPSSHVRKLHSSPSSYSPKARVSFETKVKYAAEFQESRQENISVRDETKVMKQQGILRKRIWERSH